MLTNTSRGVNRMPTASVAEVKAKFAEYSERAARGEEIVVTRYGKPVCRLMPVVKERYRYANSGIVECDDAQLTAPPFTDEELESFGIG
jgi:prevent-host-death family protein